MTKESINEKAKDLAKENLEKVEDVDIANNLLQLALKTFTEDTFNVYDYTKLVIIQLLALINEGIITEERGVSIEAEVKKILNGFIHSLNTKSKKKKRK